MESFAQLTIAIQGTVIVSSLLTLIVVGICVYLLYQKLTTK